MTTRAAWATLVFGFTALAAGPSLAGNPFGHLFARPPAKVATQHDVSAPLADQVSQALDERRYVDAADLLERARVNQVTSPRLVVLDGDLLLARGQFVDALAMFRTVGADPGEKARALEGEGLSLSMLGQSDRALNDLQQATALDKSLWRAWNGLGREYDIRHDWKKSQAAYAVALTGAGDGANAALVLNNRGYSHLLQHQTALATTDFVAALDKDPALAAARTNLRITMAIDGHYDRAAMTGVGDDRAAVLNNVGLAAAIRGDYPEAEKLLKLAIQTKGSYYARATNNLQLAKQLESHTQELNATPNVTP